MDWATAQRELIKQQALADLSVDKEEQEQTRARLEDLEQKMAAEKEEADRLLEKQRAEFEERMRLIREEQEALQQQNLEQQQRAGAAGAVSAYLNFHA